MIEIGFLDRSGCMTRLVTIAKFEEWKADPSNVEEIFRLLIEERLRLRDVAIERLKQPYTCIYRFLHDAGERPITENDPDRGGPRNRGMQARYEAALKAIADDIAQEALAISDEQREVVRPDGSKFDPDVLRDKLRVDTRMRIAEKWDRERYGQKSDIGAGGITVLVDRSCGGAVAIQAGESRVLVGGGVAGERKVSGTEALAVLAGKGE